MRVAESKTNTASPGWEDAQTIFRNLSTAELVEESIRNREGTLSDTGALVCHTGKFTGRSPLDRFIVKDAFTKDTVGWSDSNIPFEAERFDRLLHKMTAFLLERQLYVRDAYAGAHPDYRLNLRFVNTLAWHDLFCENIFLRLAPSELEKHRPAFTIICAPDFEADPEQDGTRQENFTVINFSKKIVLIGGTGYAGEIKKAVFTVMNYLLPLEQKILTMHSAANVGQAGDTAVFFGLAGTGKTTLATVPERFLIGDDAHGWNANSIFNFEGGCYAKVVNLSHKQEPRIWDAVQFGTILENTTFYEGSRTVNYADTSLTENTRAVYPIYYIPETIKYSRAGTPKHIFFLTADAFGVLPPIARLNASQALYYFLLGYTAKVEGTEVGITDPEATFSACFGEAFMPLHPMVYAELLGKKLTEHPVQVWLVNTGWTGGPFGVGSRIKLRLTRAMIRAALEGALDHVAFTTHPVFGIEMPDECLGVPASLLNPRNTWGNKEHYDNQAEALAALFIANFEKYADCAGAEIMAGAPCVGLTV
ncbi:phosphoenolpyruvate carboxykinase (ATP) [Botryobacter ruber]|uniref:phosphoenolpyruvate carboxykinase (ATP) n=1 Tax=Botryobacter ruber TaxID=2171629 RepID=UPI000E0CA6D6|nr:phosphoenolpyruvate carboxykinase (ATP) [Botryobacter ruber]